VVIRRLRVIRQIRSITLRRGVEVRSARGSNRFNGAVAKLQAIPTLRRRH